MGKVSRKGIMWPTIWAVNNTVNNGCGNAGANCHTFAIAIVILLKILNKKCGNGQTVAKAVLPHSNLLQSLQVVSVASVAI